MERYKPDQSDKDHLAVARMQGIHIAKMKDGLWAWNLRGAYKDGFATQYHAARDALAGLVQN